MLIPENELYSPVTVKISKDLIVVFVQTRILDLASRPWNGWIVVRIRILPPPYFVAVRVSSKDNIEITIPINVLERTSRLDRFVVESVGKRSRFRANG